MNNILINQLPEEIQSTIKNHLSDYKYSSDDINYIMSGYIYDSDIIYIWNDLESYFLNSIYGGIPEDEIKIILEGKIKRKEIFFDEEGNLIEIL